MKEIKNIIREMIPVILGVFLALFFNNWNETRKDKTYLKKTFASIRQELEENNTRITTILPKQQRLIDSLEKHIDNEVSIFDLLLNADGYHVPYITLHNWEAISNSRIELIEPEELFTLSEIEGGQNLINSKSQKIMDILINNMKSTDSEKKESIKILVEDLVSNEKQLQSKIENFLNQED